MKRKLKTLKALVMLSFFVFLILGCNKEDSETRPLELFEQNEYNHDFKNLALAISNAMKSNLEFRQIIKKEVLLKFDGDYNVLLSKVKDLELNERPVNSKSTDNRFLIKTLLEESLPTEIGYTRLKSTISYIDELTVKYPNLQIAVPVHAEDWDENYIPVVTFVPYEFDVNLTPEVTGYDSNGRIINLDAINEPYEPVVVISENERIPREDETKDPIMPDNPTSLTGITTESGIRLTWQMPATSGSQNTTGYYIYRKGSNDASFVVISTILGAFNRSFDDNNVIASSSYSYFVIAYYQGITSQPSNIINITAPNFPKPVISFDAIQNSKNEIELRWQNDHSQFIQETKLYKHISGVTADYFQIGSFTPSQHHFFDRDVFAGKKVIYKINHVTSLGESNPKFDFVQVPYRDISENSGVYIKAIHFTNWKIESWLNGSPEFYIKVTNVDQGNKSPFTVQDQIDLRFGARVNLWFFKNVKVMDWKPGFWYDMLTFTAIEYNRSIGELELNISVGYNQKDPEKTSFTTKGGATYKVKFGNKGQLCGNSYLSYFDNPDEGSGFPTPGTWIVFPNYGFRILISEIDW